LTFFPRFVFFLNYYQLAFLIPGIKPCQANSLKQIRQSWNLLKYPPDLPHIEQRLYLRVENLGALFHLASCEFLAILMSRQFMESEGRHKL